MGAVEIAAELRIRVGLSRAPARTTRPRIETPTHYGVVGCARPLEDAMRIAFEELIYWMEDEWGIPAPDGYLLLAQVAEARCTQMVNRTYSYICTIAKEILQCYR